MTLKEACKRIGVNYNTAKTYISQLKKSGLTIGRKKGNRLDISEEELRILKEISETSVKEFLKKNKVMDIEPVKNEKDKTELQLLSKFTEEIERQNNEIKRLNEELDLLKERLLKLESEVSNKDTFWTRLKKFLFPG